MYVVIDEDGELIVASESLMTLFSEETAQKFIVGAVRFDNWEIYNGSIRYAADAIDEDGKFVLGISIEKVKVI